MTADMTISYDSNKLEYVSSEAGSIVTNPTVNLGINKGSDGVIKALFLDYTMSEGAITTNGVFAKITFRVKNSGTANVNITNATFGDQSLKSVSAKVSGGAVSQDGSTNVQPTQAWTQPTAQPTQAWTQPTTQPAQPSSGSYSVSYSDSSWGTGATVNFIVKNNSSSAINGWSVSYTYSGDQKITSAWNCTFTQSGSSVTISNVDYNASIPAGGSTTVGFNISFSGTNNAPTNFTVNSTAISSGESSQNQTQPQWTPTAQPTPQPTQEWTQPSNGSGFTVGVSSVNGSVGQEITVPVNFTNIPSDGISTADMTISYDSSKLEYVGAEAGSIVTNPTVNLGINKGSDGTIKALFLDYTMSDGAINTSGEFLNLKFKVKNSGTATVNLTNATFGDKSLKSVNAKINAGSVSVTQ